MSIDKKLIPINYSSRDFNTIKQGLVQHAIRYYPDSFKDLSEAGFGSLMLDATSYIGDVLSFYIDYNTNESFLRTAIEFNNILRHGYKLGYKYEPFPSSVGVVAIYCLVPAQTFASGIYPDKRYAPIVKRGTTFLAGNNSFTLSEDVNMADDRALVRVAIQNSVTGAPTYHAIKMYGSVVSGLYKTTIVDIGEFEKFRKLTINDSNITEIVSITDSDGNEYKEADFLSQNIVYEARTNISPDRNQVSKVLVPIAAPRRFIVEKFKGFAEITFGASSNVTVTNDLMIEEPTKFVSKMYGRQHIGDTSFDPKKLLNSDKFGIGPSNTSLTITYRVNSTDNVNIGIAGLNSIANLSLEFADQLTLDQAKVAGARGSFSVENEESIIGDIADITVDELKTRILENFASQNRSVTEKDYEASIYSMPSQFGSIKRCRAIKDINSFKRNLNLYVISEDPTGSLVKTNSTLKSNVKTWLDKNKMVSDTIDIIDAKILNLSIDFKVVGLPGKPKYEVLNDCLVAIRKNFSRKPEIGEPFLLNDILFILKQVTSVLDVKEITVKTKYGARYSRSPYTVDVSLGSCRTPDETVVNIPSNVIWEIKFPQDDIRGVVI